MTSPGQWLRDEREARNIALDEIASATKIVARYLEALERDRLDLMPGGFFVKGIIRAYAQAVGLDPDEVLERYRSAGLLPGPEPVKGVFAKRAAPAPVPVDEPVPVPRPAPAEPPPASEEAPAEDRAPEASLVFEEAPVEPSRAPLARPGMTAWAFRGLAALVVAGAILLVWAPWRRSPAPAGTAPAPAQARLPAVSTADSPQAPAATSEPSERPAGGAPPQAAPAPAAEEVPQGLTIEISFESETWMQVYADGILRIGGLFPAGATARAQASEKLLIHTGNAGGFTFKLNGQRAKPLGRSGQVLTGIEIRPANLKDFLEAPSPSRPAG